MFLEELNVNFLVYWNYLFALHMNQMFEVKKSESLHFLILQNQNLERDRQQYILKQKLAEY